MTYNTKLMDELKHAIQIWRMNYLIEKGIDPQPHISNLVGKIEVTLDLLKRYPVRDLRDLPDIALIELELME